MIFSLVFYVFFLWGQFEKNLSIKYNGIFIYNFCNGLGIEWVVYFLIGIWGNIESNTIAFAILNWINAVGKTFSVPVK